MTLSIVLSNTDAKVAFAVFRKRLQNELNVWPSNEWSKNSFWRTTLACSSLIHPDKQCDDWKQSQWITKGACREIWISCADV